jgi:hypothetical protein
MLTRRQKQFGFTLTIVFVLLTCLVVLIYTQAKTRDSSKPKSQFLRSTAHQASSVYYRATFTLASIPYSTALLPDTDEFADIANDLQNDIQTLYASAPGEQSATVVELR